MELAFYCKSKIKRKVVLLIKMATPDKDEIGKILDLRRLKRPLGNSLGNDF